MFAILVLHLLCNLCFRCSLFKHLSVKINCSITSFSSAASMHRGKPTLKVFYCAIYWIISVSSGWFVWGWTLSLEKKWYHVMSRSTDRENWFQAHNWFVWGWTLSLEKKWYHVMSRSTDRENWFQAHNWFVWGRTLSLEKKWYHVMSRSTDRENWFQAHNDRQHCHFMCH